MVLTPDGDGGFRANGGKYYIGNGNVAGMVSVFGRRADVEGPDGYVFFAADSQAPDLRADQERRQLADVRQRVPSCTTTRCAPRTSCTPAAAAFDAALNTVNVGKFNLGFASIGICEHAFYEAITHAAHRILYGQPGDRLPARAADAHRRLRAAARDEAVRRARDRLLPQRRAPRTGATCSSTRSRR